MRSCWAWFGDVVPDGAEEEEAAEEDDAGADDVPAPLLAPSSCPIEVLDGALPDWPPDEEAAVGLPPPPAEDDAALALGEACWALFEVAVRLEADAVQPVCEGWEPPGAYGGCPPGSGGQVPGLEGSGELTPGWLGPRNE